MTEANLLLEEANRLPFTEETERVAMVNAINALSPEVTGGQGYEQLYDAVVFNMQNVLAVMTRYEGGVANTEHADKKARANKDIELSAEPNPQTNKPYTRGAIEAHIETDAGVIELGGYRRDVKSIVRFCRALHEVYRVHYERIVNANVNARRGFDAPM